MAKKVDPIKAAGLEVKLNTPVGIGQYAYLETPDFEYNSDGDWKVKIFFDPADEKVQAMTSTMDDLLAKALEYFTKEATTVKAKKAIRLSENTPYYSETDDEDEPTGRIYINPKCIASGTTKEGEPWKRGMPIFDAQGQKVETKLNIGNGTKMAANLTLRAYYNKQSGVGISLRLGAVQIIDLKEYTGGITDAESAGFGKVEGGFAADTFTATGLAASFGSEPDADPADDGNGDY